LPRKANPGLPRILDGATNGLLLVKEDIKMCTIQRKQIKISEQDNTTLLQNCLRKVEGETQKKYVQQ
jgi:hypothetical protein